MKLSNPHPATNDESRNFIVVSSRPDPIFTKHLTKRAQEIANRHPGFTVDVRRDGANIIHQVVVHTREGIVKLDPLAFPIFSGTDRNKAISRQIVKELGGGLPPATPVAAPAPVQPQISVRNLVAENIGSNDKRGNRVFHIRPRGASFKERVGKVVFKPDISLKGFYVSRRNRIVFVRFDVEVWIGDRLVSVNNEYYPVTTTPAVRDYFVEKIVKFAPGLIAA